MDKLIGFAPDADPTTPGVLTSVTNLIPYEQGMRGAPTGVNPVGVPALAAECRGAAVVTKLDGSRRIIAGTETKLYELTGGSWVDSGLTYASGVDGRWSIAQFGNSTLASNGVEAIQRSSGAGFTAISGAPVAKIIFSVGNQMMALNTNDGTSKPDGWHCSAAFDDTSWSPSLTTLAASGRLVSQPGACTAGGRMGEYAVAYKEKSIYLGQFVGAPVVWDWTQVPGGEAGCVGQDAWTDIGGAHFFVGLDNFWIFDGSRPVPVGNNIVRQWFFANSSPNFRYKTKCVSDLQNDVVWVFYCSTNSTVNDQALVYHLKSQMWGAATMTVQAALSYIAAGVTIDGLSSVSSTIDALPSVAFDSQYWLTGGRALAVFNTSNQLQAVIGPTSTSSLTTGEVGDDDMVTLLTQIRLRFYPSFKPTTATCQTFAKMELGDSPTSASTSTLNDGRFDVLDSARFHSARVDFTGDHRLMSIGWKLTPEGNV